MDDKVMGWFDTILSTGIQWGNQIMEFFGLYTSKYSKMILVLIGLWLLSGFFKLHIKTGGGR